MLALVSKTIFTARRTLGALELSAPSRGIIAKLRSAAPYALMELILPGGSLMALLLWLYRRRKRDPAFATREILVFL